MNGRGGSGRGLGLDGGIALAERFTATGFGVHVSLRTAGLGFCVGLGASPFTVFADLGDPLAGLAVLVMFARLTQHADLGRWHPHELRHSATSIMSAAGVPPERIADTLGHDGTRMVLQVYRHAVSPTITAPRIMNEILGT